MGDLRCFWSLRIDDGHDLMPEVSYTNDLIITQVALADGGTVKSRATLSAEVETLLMDRPEINGAQQSVTYETVLAVFFEGGPRFLALNIGFTSTDICILKARGAAFIVSGYTMKSSLRMSDFAPS
jgi:hypothetical protein